jgi:hypothetical protein
MMNNNFVKYEASTTGQTNMPFVTFTSGLKQE